MSTIAGSAGDDSLAGFLGDDVFEPGAGDDTLDGMAGRDVVVFSGNAADYRFDVDGAYLRVTDMFAADGDDGSDLMVRVQTLRFADREYRLLTERRINETVAGDQQAPSLTALGTGYVVSWQSYLQDGDGYGVFVQRFDDAALPLGTELQVNLHSIGDQSAPVVVSAGGGFAVAWSSALQDGSEGGIYLRLFRADGGTDGADLAVNETSVGNQQQPDAAALSGGGMVVVWSGNGQDGSGYGVFARRLADDGTPLDGEFRINTRTTGDQLAPVVCALPGGGFVVAWQSWGQDSSAFGIYAQVFSADGTAVGAEFRINQAVSQNQIMPALAALADGGFVAAWASQSQDGSGYGVYARTFDALGTADGSEFPVNSTLAYDQTAPSVSGFGDGSFIVSWDSRLQDGSGFAVYARRFDADGVALIDELRINTTTINHQSTSSVLTFADGGYAVAWQSLAQDSDLWGIFGQRFDPDGIPIGRPEIVGTPADDRFDLEGIAGVAASGLAGNDWYVVDSAGDSPFETTGQGVDTVESSISWVLTEAIENLVLVGDAVDGTGNALANSLSGNAESNRLDGGAGADTLDGGAGRDTLVGGAGADVYLVEAGDVIVEFASGGVDTVVGAMSWTLANTLENLTLTGSNPVHGYGNNAPNFLTGNEAANDLRGNSQADTVQGGAGDDTLIGGGGGDLLAGGSGDDFYIADFGDTLTELANEGIDTIQIGASWTLAAAFENLVLIGSTSVNGTGNAADNEITGNNGTNRLVGAGGTDFLRGGAGNDLLYGGAGSDTLNGGPGSDRFIFDAALDANTNFDLVSVFEPGSDRIVLDDDVFAAFNAAASTRLATAAFYAAPGATAAHDADDRIIYDESTAVLYYDEDGLGGADAIAFAQLGANPQSGLVVADFLIAP